MIRTTDQLLDKIANEIIWRRKELTDLRGLVQENSGELRSRVLIRCAVALLYAHWEGFVKTCGSHYVEFVAAHRVPYKYLSANFIGIVLKSKYSELGVNKKVAAGNSLAKFFTSDLERQSSIPYKTAIDTKSNLSSEVLVDIVDALGLDKSNFVTRLKYIDANLVNPRNYIAHGEALDISLKDYLVLHDDVLELIQIFRNEVENASVQRSFDRRHSPSPASS
jgi:hypothetical protein